MIGCGPLQRFIGENFKRLTHSELQDRSTHTRENFKRLTHSQLQEKIKN